ncbi:integrator complex subunit 5-like [Glandiceps talaboti]
MASVVGILGHLAAQHSKDIRKALLELFQASVDSTDEQQLSTVPFLLQLATMSPMLLKVITTDLVDCLTPEVLNRLSDQFYNSPVILQDADGLITLVIHLICKSGSGTSKLLHFVLDTAAPQITENRMEDDEIVVSERVQQCAALILDLLLLNLQRGVYSKTGGRFRSGQSEMSEIPFLIELQRHSSDLCKDILTATGKRLYWLQRLLSVIGVHCGESCASDILSYLMLNTKSENKSSQVRLFLDLQAGLESSLPTVLHVAVKKSLYHLQNANDIQMLQLLTNLTLLVKWEGSRQGQETAKTQLRRILQNSVQILSCLLYHPSPSMSYQTIKLLDLVGIATNTNADTLTHLVQCTMQYFFNTLHKQERKTDAIVTTVRYLRTLSCHPPSQTTVLQFLVQAVVKRENSYLFGGKLGDNASIKDPAASQLSLHQNNLKHALSVTVPATASTVFHAGVIGKGKRQKVERTISPQHVQMQNIQAVLDTLYSCGILDTKKPNQMDSSFSRTPKLLSAQSSNTVASLLVQFACPDVIHAGTQWPDEELMKYTIERDLHIKKKFEDNPVLWDLLRIVAKAKPALCQCSVLIYGLLSTLLAFWESNREKQACDSPKQMQMSVRLLECMALADFLPRPLGQVGELLHLLTPYEVYLLLVNTWAYMKEHPPSEKSFTDEEKTSQQPVEPRYTKILHFTLHHNIGACGHLFPRFFNLDSISR